MVTRDADAHQGLAAREIVSAANQRLHAGAADHGLHTWPNRALRDHEVHFGADHVVAVRHIDGATAHHRARVPCAVKHDDDARVARLLVIRMGDAWRDRQRSADSHADQQRGPWNAVHETLTHDDLPACRARLCAGWPMALVCADVRCARSSGGLCVEDRNRYGKTHAPYGERQGCRMVDHRRVVHARFGQRGHAPNGGGNPVNRCGGWICGCAG